MLNPYAPPIETAADPAVQGRSVARTFFFVINFSTAGLFFGSCVLCIAVPRNPFAVVGALLALAPVGSYVLAELIGFVRNSRAIEVGLGVANLACACLVAFGVVSNVVEALGFEETESITALDLALFVLVGAVICGYLVLSGRYRLHGGKA